MISLRMVAGLMDRVMQLGTVDFPDFHQILFGQDTGGLEDILLLVDAQLGGQHAPMLGGHVGGGLEPDDVGELAVAQGRLDHRQQVVGLLLPSIGVGVAGNPEKFMTVNHQPGKDLLKVVGDQVLEGDEQLLAADRDKAGHPDTQRHLDPVQELVLRTRLTGGHQKIQRQVRDERKGVGRIDTLGGQKRVDLFLEIDVHLLFLGGAQLFVCPEADMLFFEKIAQYAFDAALLDQDILGHPVAGVDLLLGEHTVNGLLFDPGADLLLETADPLHEEFIQVGADHGHEEDPLQQRHPLIGRFAEHPLVEGQPGQLPVQVALVAFQIERGWWWCFCSSCHDV